MEKMTMTALSQDDFKQLIRGELLSFFETRKPTHDEHERLTRVQVCNLYKISLPTLHDQMKKGLPFEKIGRKTVFKRSEVDKYFSGRRGPK